MATDDTALGFNLPKIKLNGSGFLEGIVHSLGVDVTGFHGCVH